MNRLLPLLLAVAALLPAVSAHQRPARFGTPPVPPVATGHEHLLDHERAYDVNPETGEVTLSPEARAGAEARVRARRETRLAELAHLPQPERARRSAPPPTGWRGGPVFTVDNAYEDADLVPGDGLCATFFNDCSLRAAIEETNATPGTDPVTVEFAISFGPPGSFDAATGSWTFEVNSTGLGSYPTISRSNVTIDGETQAGASCGLLPVGTVHDLNVVLDGSLTASGGGLSGFSAGLTVRGLVIRDFTSGYGLALSGANSLAECNYIGTDATGEVAAGNLDGVFMGSIASGTVVRDNLVSGNLDNGLDAFGNAQTVSGNFVGTDDDGNQVLGNGDDGLFIAGRDGLIDGNLISGNVDRGVVLGQFSTFVGPATRMTLTNNTIGLDRLRGNAGYGNGDDGIAVIQGASDNDIGLPGGVNYIAAHPSTGVYISGSGTDDNRVRNNVIGLDLSGNAQPNNRGISVSGGPGGTVIGSGSDGNLIAGNLFAGIDLSLSTGSLVEGNTIGLNAAGTARGNGFSGLRLNGNTNATVHQNVISGNGDFGIFDNLSTGTLIDGNTIGLDASGAPRPNLGHGIALVALADATVRNNTIASNEASGIWLDDLPQDVVIEANRIGVAPDGSARGNGADGVLCLGADDVQIGGLGLSANTIAHNGTANPDADGIFLTNFCTEVAIGYNRIHSNAGLGIDWCPDFPSGCDAVTPNDSPDADGVPNYPVVTAAENDGTDATITATLAALPGRVYALRFYRISTPDPSGYGEGEVPIAARDAVETDGSGQITAALVRPASDFPPGSWVTVTATLLDASFLPEITSEFSQAVQVEDTSGPAYDLTATNTSPLTVAPGGSVGFDYSVTNNTATPATGHLWFVAERGGATVAQGVIRSGTLPAGTTISGSYTQAVPSSAPPGAYTYRLRIGQFPSPTVDEEVFTVTVTGSAREDGPAEWSLTDVTPWTEQPTDGTEAASRGEALPTVAALTDAYPNPFSRSATVAFSLPEAERVMLAVYDVLGREVARLVDGETEAGRHEVLLDGAALPAGVYLVRLVTKASTQTQRLTLVR